MSIVSLDASTTQPELDHRQMDGEVLKKTCPALEVTRRWGMKAIVCHEPIIWCSISKDTVAGGRHCLFGLRFANRYWD